MSRINFINRNLVNLRMFIASEFISADIVPASRPCLDDLTLCGASI